MTQPPIYRLTRTIVYEGPEEWIGHCLRVNCNQIWLGPTRKMSETRSEMELINGPELPAEEGEAS